MTVIFYGKEETESTTNSSSWQTKLSVQKTVEYEVREHKIFVYSEIGGSVERYAVEVRVMLNSVERAFTKLKPCEDDAYQSFIAMGIIDLGSGTHTVEVQYRSTHTNQTAKIRRVRAFVEKY